MYYWSRRTDLPTRAHRGFAICDLHARCKVLPCSTVTAEQPMAHHWGLRLGSAVVALLRPWCTCAERGRPQCSAVREHPVPEHRTRPSGSGAASNTLLRCPHVGVMYVSVFYAPRHTSERVWHLCCARGAWPQSVRPQCSAVHSRTAEHPST